MPTRNDTLATATHTTEGWTVRFERDYAHAPEKVWRAITESEHLQHWFPADIVGERRAGATLTLPFWPPHVEKYADITPTLTGEIRVWEPPSVFELTWDTDVLRFELTPTALGTHLVFTTHLVDDSAMAASTAAGYHVCFDYLMTLLDEGSTTALVDAEVGPLEDAYAEVIAAAK